MADILFPVGRMIGGSLYKAQPKTDNAGKPKIGADGKPETSFNFGVAIQKQPGQTHWSQTEWGAEIWRLGHAGYPGIASAPTFAWKITDGDSTVPNKKNRRPCDQEGYPGHWVLWFSQGWAPKLCSADGTVILTDPDVIMPGDWVQVFASVKDNKPAQSPGMYLNPQAVAFVGYHAMGRIATSSVDTTAVGFGQAPLPAGVVATPPGMPAAPAVAPPPGAPAAPAAYVPPPAAAPNPAFLQPPPSAPAVGAPPAPPAYAPPPAAPVRRMLPAANGATYESCIAQGWTDATLIQHGLMAAL